MQAIMSKIGHHASWSCHKAHDWNPNMTTACQALTAFYELTTKLCHATHACDFTRLDIIGKPFTCCNREWRNSDDLWTHKMHLRR